MFVWQLRCCDWFAARFGSTRFRDLLGWTGIIRTCSSSFSSGPPDSGSREVHVSFGHLLQKQNSNPVHADKSKLHHIIVIVPEEGVVGFDLPPSETGAFDGEGEFGWLVVTLGPASESTGELALSLFDKLKLGEMLGELLGAMLGEMLKDGEIGVRDGDNVNSLITPARDAVNGCNAPTPNLPSL